MLNKFHPYHMVSISPWPIVSALLSFSLVTHFTTSFYSSFSMKSMMIFMTLLISSFMWWKDVSRESSMQGYHQSMVTKGLKLGMILFIVSEILFFSSFFWAYFHSSLSPMLEIGQTWPPLSIKAFNPMNVPLLNTIILVSSGASVTWSHHAILSNQKFQAIMSLSITCLLGVYFSLLQAMEYFQAEFSISDSSYGSSFFMATGFHGIHVLIGTSFLLVSLMRLNKIHNPSNHIIGFELAAWYWHFVDVVWLFLYMSIYWWGN